MEKIVKLLKNVNKPMSINENTLETSLAQSNVLKLVNRALRNIIEFNYGEKDSYKIN